MAEYTTFVANLIYGVVLTGVLIGIVLLMGAFVIIVITAFMDGLKGNN